MYTRFQVTEYNEGQQPIYVWLVDVPPSWSGSSASLKISRAMHSYQDKMRFYNMDSHTVRSTKKTVPIEEAVQKFMGGGGEHTLIKGVPRYSVALKGKVERNPTKQRQRSNDVLQPIGANMIKGDATKGTCDVFTVDAILDSTQPVRYQVVIPMPHYDDPREWKIMLYRRLNPRSKGAPDYGLRPMATGKVQTESLFTSYEMAVLDDAVQRMKGVIDPERHKTMANSLAIFERQISKATRRYASSFAPDKNSITARLHQVAKTVGDALFAVTREPTPEHIQTWTSIMENMNQQRSTLGPKFDAHLRALESRATLKRPENQQASIHAPQTGYNGGIPPMPTLADVQARNALRAATAPATAIPEAQPIHNPQTALDILGNLLNPT